MADTLPFSSQQSDENSSPVLHHIQSSPLRPHSKPSLSSNNRIKKPPTITPKRFTKFFTPRLASSSKPIQRSRAGQQLRDITRNGVNRRRVATATSTDPFNNTDDEPLSDRPLKKQKIAPVDLSSSPLRSSPLKRVQLPVDIPIFEDGAPGSPTCSDADSLPDWPDCQQPLAQPIQRLRMTGSSRRLLTRSFGGHDAIGRGFRGAEHGSDYRCETAHFVSEPTDKYDFESPYLPFCVTSCNTNSLIAAGDEGGTINIFDSSPESKFSETYISFCAHKNAIIDISFNNDDSLLATASGDQTAAIIDMKMQRTLCVLLGHIGTVKQVRFNPSDDNMVTTSGRDGSVQFWDMRCGGKSSVQNLRASYARRLDADEACEPEHRYGQQIDVGLGHSTAQRPFDFNRPDLSITSFQHLPFGSGHLIATASEASAAIKLWDLRNANRRNLVAIASTTIPDSHTRIRNFGISSMVMSGDGSRLYATCRDSIVYTYSTHHLALGHTPEMSSGTSRRRTLKEPGTGLAPLYAFSHPLLRVGTFYVKSALRPARGEETELLAVGSSEHGPVLFPTDERYLLRSNLRTSTLLADDTPPQLPVYNHGTPLIRGHSMENTSLTWTPQGNLISLSDDYVARCWRENPSKARELRTGGEGGGVRWHHGWADVSDDWDEEDC